MKMVGITKGGSAIVEMNMSEIGILTEIGASLAALTEPMLQIAPPKVPALVVGTAKLLDLPAGKTRGPYKKGLNAKVAKSVKKMRTGTSALPGKQTLKDRMLDAMSGGKSMDTDTILKTMLERGAMFRSKEPKWALQVLLATHKDVVKRVGYGVYELTVKGAKAAAKLCTTPPTTENVTEHAEEIGALNARTDLDPEKRKEMIRAVVDKMNEKERF